jgi:polysaccharide biosynthesis protein PslH
VIRHLAREHEVTVLSLARSAQEEAEAAGIAPHCHAFRALRVHNAVQAAKIAVTLPTAVSASEAFFHSVALQREVDRALDSRSFDLVFAHCSAVGRYVEQAQGIPKVMDFCDVDSRKWADYVPHKPWPLAMGYRWEAWRMAAAERRMAARFDQVTVATRGEADTLAEMGVRDRVDWFANGVDFGYFQPSAEPFDANVITFVGRMDYFPNEQCMADFCADTWPLLRAARPSLRLQIVGAAPTARVLALGRIDGVTVTGSVPDVRPYVQRSALTITPLKIARGTQNKILESMAMAVPVISSRIAAAGVDAVAGQHLAVADSPQELCDTILRIAGDAQERRRLGEAGRARVLSHHAWTSAMQRLDGIIERSVRPVGGLRVAAAAP